MDDQFIHCHQCGAQNLWDAIYCVQCRSILPGQARMEVLYSSAPAAPLNTYAWIVALLPMWGIIVNLLSGPLFAVFLTLFLSFMLTAYDRSLLGNGGHDISRLTPLTLVVPVLYLFRRASITFEGLMMWQVWILSMWFVLFTEFILRLMFNF